MFSSNIWMAHRFAMLSSCSFCLPICSHPTVLPSVYRAVLFLLSTLCGRKHSWAAALPLRGWWSSGGLPCLPDVSWLPNQHSSRPGLGSHPPAERCHLAACLSWGNCFWQKSFCTFRTASLNADCWNGRRQLLTLPSGKAQFTKGVLSSDPSWAMRVQRVGLNFSFFY